MTTATASTARSESGTCERAFDVARQVAHISHEAQLLKSVATDAVEDGVHAAKRAIKSARRYADECADLKDEAARYVKRQPFKAVGCALASGVVLGLAIGWIGGECKKFTATSTTERHAA